MKYRGILAAAAAWVAWGMWGCGELSTGSPDTHVEMDAAHDVGADAGWMEEDLPPLDSIEVPIDAGMDATDAEPDMTVDAAMTASLGCVTPGDWQDGEHTLTVMGRERRYMLRLPANYTPDRAWPLVFALHGNGGSVSYWDQTTGDRNIRGVLQQDAILIVAEAIGGNWRDYDADPSTWPARIDEELVYFDTIIEDAKTNLCVRPDAVFAMGFSGGGSFSGVLGCRRTDIRAIAVGGSVIYFDKADCVGEPAAWITIGTQELVAGREEFRDFFRDHAGCAATSTRTDPDPCVAYDGCDEATPVTYCQHPDGHIWPSFGSQTAWDFFKQFVAP